MLRIFIFIFVLSSLASPAIAAACDMMNDKDMSSLSHDMSSMNHDLSHEDMKAHMDHDHSCNSVACLSVCNVSFLIVKVDTQKSLTIEVLSRHPRDKLLSLYETFLPINTPPPLV